MVAITNLSLLYNNEISDQKCISLSAENNQMHIQVEMHSMQSLNDIVCHCGIYPSD